MFEASPSEIHVRRQSADRTTASRLSIHSAASPAGRPRSSQSQSRTVSSQAPHRKPAFSKPPQSLDESLLSLGSETATRSALRTWTSPSKVLQLDELQGEDVVAVMEETCRLQQQLVLLKSVERKMWWSESRRVRKLAKDTESEQQRKEFGIRTGQWKDELRLKDREQEQARKALIQLKESEFRENKQAKLKAKSEQQRRLAEDLKRAVGTTQEEASRLEAANRRKVQEEERAVAKRLREERKEAALAAKRVQTEEAERLKQEISFDHTQRTSGRLKDVLLQTQQAVLDLSALQSSDI